MKTMKIEITEDLYERILDELSEAEGYRMHSQNYHMNSVCTKTAAELITAYDNGIPSDIEEAYYRFNKGEKPSWSTGFCGATTVGYGELDNNGYFEFPLVISEETGFIMPWEDYLGESK